MNEYEQQEMTAALEFRHEIKAKGVYLSNPLFGVDEIATAFRAGAKWEREKPREKKPTLEAWECRKCGNRICCVRVRGGVSSPGCGFGFPTTWEKVE